MVEKSHDIPRLLKYPLTEKNPMTIPGISEIPVLSTLKYQVHMSSHSVLTPHFSETSNNIYASFYLVFQRNEKRFWGSNQLNHFLKEHITRLEMYLPQSVSINWFQSNKFCQPLECHKKTFELSFILLNLLANCQVLSFFHVLSIKIIGLVFWHAQKEATTLKKSNLSSNFWWKSCW